MIVKTTWYNCSTIYSSLWQCQDHPLKPCLYSSGKKKNILRKTKYIFVWYWDTHMLASAHSTVICSKCFLFEGQQLLSKKILLRISDEWSWLFACLAHGICVSDPWSMLVMSELLFTFRICFKETKHPPHASVVKMISGFRCGEL